MPVVLISTISQDGIRNAAPWGCITPILRPRDEILIASWLRRDTLDNIRETGEFVVNVPRSDMEKEVEICAKGFPPEVDEFVEAGLIPRPSAVCQTSGDRGLCCLDGMRIGRGDLKGGLLADNWEGCPSGGKRQLLWRGGRDGSR